MKVKSKGQSEKVNKTWGSAAPPFVVIFITFVSNWIHRQEEIPLMWPGSSNQYHRKLQNKGSKQKDCHLSENKNIKFQLQIYVLPFVYIWAIHEGHFLQDVNGWLVPVPLKTKRDYMVVTPVFKAEKFKELVYQAVFTASSIIGSSKVLIHWWGIVQVLPMELNNILSSLVW